MGLSLAFVFIGALIWLLAFANHDIGEGSVSVPRAMKRFVRVGDGPAKLSSLAAEALGAVFVVTAVAMGFDALTPEVFLRVAAIATTVVVLLDVVIGARRWLRTRRHS